MQNQLQKAIKLAKKTGDKLIMFDSAEPDYSFVVMSLDEYEKILTGTADVRGLTEEQLLDKINRDVAIWKSDQESNIWEEEDILPKRNIRANDSWDIWQEEKKNENIRRSGWRIPAERKKGAEEVIEEDRQYLEEVPF